MRWLATLILLAGPPARAAEVALNAGAIEVLALPGPSHAGLYPYIGVSLVVPTEKVTLIPGLAFELAPESGRLGLVASLVADWALSDRLGFDLNAALIHDQPGLDFRASEFFIGAGPGVSAFFGKWTASLYVNVFRGLNVDVWSVVPGVNIARTL